MLLFLVIYLLFNGIITSARDKLDDTRPKLFMQAVLIKSNEWPECARITPLSAELQLVDIRFDHPAALNDRKMCRIRMTPHRNPSDMTEARRQGPGP